ncbi:MAG: hypothetical protein WC492_02445 [Candidatus Micrarchaeia archaeon]
MARFFESEQVGQTEQGFNQPSWDSARNPLLERPEPPKFLKHNSNVEDSARFFSDVIYEFRTAKRDIEASAERICRLGRIGMLVNRMKVRQMLDFGDSDDSDNEGEKTVVRK